MMTGSMETFQSLTENRALAVTVFPLSQIAWVSELADFVHIGDSLVSWKRVRHTAQSWPVRLHKAKVSQPSSELPAFCQYYNFLSFLPWYFGYQIITYLLEINVSWDWLMYLLYTLCVCQIRTESESEYIHMPRTMKNSLENNEDNFY
jgi:hypothetical protein